MAGTQFVGNTAKNDGGGAWQYGLAQLSGTHFDNNRCGALDCSGGGLYAKTTLNLTGTQFLGNAAGIYGDGLHVECAAQVYVVRALRAITASQTAALVGN